LRVRGPIEPLPGWSGVLHHVSSCACVLLSVGNLRRTSHAARMHATHARPPYSEDYRANIIISLSLQGVPSTLHFCVGVVEIALSQVLAATPIALGEPRIGAAYHIHMLPLVSESKHQKLKVGPNKKLRNTLGSPTPAKHKSQRTHPFRTWGIAHPHLGEDSISEKRTI